MQKDIFYIGTIGAAMFLIGFSIAYLSYSPAPGDTFVAPQVADMSIDTEPRGEYEEGDDEDTSEWFTLEGSVGSQDAGTYELRTYWQRAPGRFAQDLVFVSGEGLNSGVVAANIDMEAQANVRLEGWVGTSTEYLLLRQIKLETASPNMPFLRYNLTTNAVEEVVGRAFFATSTAADGFDFGRYTVSPNGRYIAWVPQSLDTSIAQQLYLIDALTNSYTEAVTLTGTENFNGGDRGMEVSMELRWIGDNTLSYGVFDGESYGELKELRLYRIAE